jgi:hypothetical protein
LVKHQNVGPELHRAEDQILHLASSHQEARVGSGSALDDRVDDAEARGRRKLGKLFEGFFRIVNGTSCDADEYRAVFRCLVGASGPAAADFLLERSDQARKIDVKLRRGARIQETPCAAAGIEWEQVRGVGLPGQAAGVCSHGDHHVELEQREVSEIVFGQRLGVQMRVHEPQPAQSPAAGRVILFEIGHEHRLSVAHDDVGDSAPAVYQDADLSPDLV